MRLPSTGSAVPEFEFGDVEIVEARFGKVFFTKIAVKHCVRFVEPFGKFPGTKRSESEAHMFRCGVYARLPIAAFLNVGFHLSKQAQEEIITLCKGMAREVIEALSRLHFEKHHTR